MGRHKNPGITFKQIEEVLSNILDQLDHKTIGEIWDEGKNFPDYEAVYKKLKEARETVKPKFNKPL